MFRTLIRHSQRFAWLMLLVAMAVGGAPAQTQVKKAAPAEQPTGLVCCPRPTRPNTKRSERVVETEKSGVKQPASQQAEQRGIAVGEKTGSSQKTIELSERGRLVEQAGGIRRRVEEAPSVPQKAKEEASEIKRRGKDLPLVPQKTKDAIGSPQKAKQKPETEILVGEPTGVGRRTEIELKKPANDWERTEEPSLRRIRGTKGNIRTTATEEAKGAEAADIIKKKGKAKADKTDAKRVEKEAPTLIREPRRQ